MQILNNPDCEKVYLWPSDHITINWTSFTALCFEATYHPSEVSDSLWHLQRNKSRDPWFRLIQYKQRNKWIDRRLINIKLWVWFQSEIWTCTQEVLRMASTTLLIPYTRNQARTLIARIFIIRLLAHSTLILHLVQPTATISPALATRLSLWGKYKN